MILFKENNWYWSVYSKMYSFMNRGSVTKNQESFWSDHGYHLFNSFPEDCVLKIQKSHSCAISCVNKKIENDQNQYILPVYMTLWHFCLKWSFENPLLGLHLGYKGSYDILAQVCLIYWAVTEGKWMTHILEKCTLALCMLQLMSGKNKEQAYIQYMMNLWEEL